jgi:polyisoprenoid-binding protein YceI
MPNVEKFVVDCKASRFTVKAFASGMTSGLGHNPTIGIRDFEGEARFVPDTLDSASLTMKIRAASLTVEDEMNREDRRQLEHIMNNQVLLTSRYPEVVYRTMAARAVKLGDSLFRVELAGQLILNGVTRNQAVTSQVTVGPYTLRATGNFEIKQSDFGITPANVAGGLLTLRDELKFAFFIVARQEGQADDSRHQEGASSALSR